MSDIIQKTGGRRIMVAPNATIGPYMEGTVLSEQHLVETHRADINHILRNGGGVLVDDKTPLTAIPGADIAPLVALAHPVAGGWREPVYVNPDGSPAQMAQVQTPHAPGPLPGQVPVVQQTDAQRAESQPNVQVAVPPKTDKELHANDEPPIEPEPLGGTVDKMFPAPGQEPPPTPAAPKAAEPVDLEEKPGTGVSEVAENEPADNAHRPASRGRKTEK